MRHLASAQWDRPANDGIMHSLRTAFSVVWRAGVTPYFTPCHTLHPFFDLLGGALYGNNILHP